MNEEELIETDITDNTENNEETETEQIFDDPEADNLNTELSSEVYEEINYITQESFDGFVDVYQVVSFTSIFLISVLIGVSLVSLLFKRF